MTHIQKHAKYDLIDIFSDCYTLILQLRKTHEYGDQEILRKRTRELLNKAESEAKEAGVNDEDIHMVIFALVALLDETIITSEWSQKDAWLARPLQLELFNRFDSGEEFFVRLEKLRRRPQYNKSVLEIYYLCMTLGFKGKYQFQEREKLRQLIEETYDDLRHIKGKSAEILSPQGQRKDEFVEVVSKEVPFSVVVISAVAIGFIFYLIMTLLISNAANTVNHIINSII